MTADVPGEAIVVDKGGGETADVGIAFEEAPVGLVEFAEMMCGAEAGGARVVCSLACLADKTREDADG